MASWVKTCCIYLWILVQSRRLSAVAPPPQYKIYRTRLSFDQAAKACSPGVLTTIATEQEVTKVLELVPTLVSPQSEFTFWVGLKKAKNQCVVPMLPLRGFRWLEDDGQQSEVNRWSKEPQDTCTTVRCAALQGEVQGSTVTRWGLIPLSCKNDITHQFICKHRDGQTGRISEDRMTSPKPAEPEPTKTATPEPKGPTQGSEVGPELAPGPGTGSGGCQKPNVPGARFIRLGSDNSSMIQVECWSVRLELHCGGRVAAWRLPDESVANFSTICKPCGAGLMKDASAHCVDVDECSGAPCRHTCLNTEGSFRCVCSDQAGNHHDDGSAECVSVEDNASPWGILLPVLVAVATLVVLVAVVAVTVKCCLRRQKKKRSMKEEEMAMKNNE